METRVASVYPQSTVAIRGVKVTFAVFRADFAKKHDVIAKKHRKVRQL